MNDVKAVIGKRLIELRESRRFTQEQVAEMFGAKPNTYGAYERGSNPIPVELLVELSKYYNVSMDWLTGFTDIKERARSWHIKGQGTPLSPLFEYNLPKRPKYGEYSDTGIGAKMTWTHFKAHYLKDGELTPESYLSEIKQRYGKLPDSELKKQFVTKYLIMTQSSEETALNSVLDIVVTNAPADAALINALCTEDSPIGSMAFLKDSLDYIEGINSESDDVSDNQETNQ